MSSTPVDTRSGSWKMVFGNREAIIHCTIDRSNRCEMYMLLYAYLNNMHTQYNRSYEEEATWSTQETIHDGTQR